MNIDKIVFYGRDGSQHYVDDEKSISQIMLSVPTKLPWKHTANIEKLRNQYFRMVTELAKHGGSGYHKTDLHEALKPMLLNALVDFKECFNDRVFTNTTTNTLTYEGWRMVIDRLKVLANDIFNYTFHNIKP